MTLRQVASRVVPPTLLERLLLPNAGDTLLLRACLLRGEAASLAFAAWSADAPAALRQLQASGGVRRRLLPLLQAALQREGIAAPPLLQPPLRAAALYEQLRTEAYTEIAGHVLRALRQARIPYLATRGVVFAQTLYTGGLRHCHDIDLLVPEASRDAALALLTGHCGFKPDAAIPGGTTDRVLLHPSGLPLTLHTHAMRSAMLTLPPWKELYAGRATVEVAGEACDVLGPEVSLLQVLLLGPFGPQRGSLVWVCDACKLIEQTVLNWPVFVDTIATAVELLPVLRVLEYLAREFDCAVPAAVLEGLGHRWSDCGSEEKRQVEETLLLGLVQHGAVAREQVWQQATSTRDHAAALRVLLWPSTRALSQAGAIGNAREAPGYRLGQVAHALRWLLRGRGNASSE